MLAGAPRSTRTSGDSSDHDTKSSSSIAEENKKALQFIEDVTMNAGEVQEKVLAEILSRSGNVEYLQKHGLNGQIDSETFKKVTPVITYDDLAPYVDRIANGDTSPILCSSPISEFLTSSGTSGGERKLMPTIAEEMERRAMMYNLINATVCKFFPGLEKGKRMLFLFTKSEAKTPGGLVAQPALSAYYKSLQFKRKTADCYNITSPTEAILCPDSYQSMYTQLLCGLCQNTEVVCVGATFASGFLRIIKFLENHWELLCEDIRTGTPNLQIVTDESLREVVIMEVLTKPNPELADFIQGACKTGSWRGIITRLWPNTKFIDAIVTGAMDQYIPTLDYYSGGIPLVSSIYGSSECYFGLNINPIVKPSEVSYLILPVMGYFEFLPVINRKGSHNVSGFNLVGDDVSAKKLDEEDMKPVNLVDVKLGHQYELIVTNYGGLYRYRVGDILQVTGFKNKAPLFKFIGRDNVALSIDSDKTSEAELRDAVKAAANHLQSSDLTLVDYTSYADTSTIPGHYVLFWELSYNNSATSLVPASVMENCCLTIEETLNSVYRQGRVSDKSIGALEIRVVEKGTFDQLMDIAIHNGASFNQYKTPRCVKYAPLIELLNSRVVSSYFSPKSPNWVPGHKKWFDEVEVNNKKLVC